MIEDDEDGILFYSKGMNVAPSTGIRSKLTKRKRVPSSILRLTKLVRNCARIIFALVAKVSLQQERVILTYHSIASSGDLFSVTPDAFRRQMDYLRENYSVLPLADMLNFVKRRGHIPRKSVSITFDDGYHDFYTNAYPYLRKHNLPATVFVATKYIGKTWPFDGGISIMLQWNEISEISRNRIEIGAHTVSHTNLKEQRIEEVKREIIDSKKELERRLNKKIAFFSYPFGGYSQQTIELVKDCGFEGAVGATGSVQEGLCPFAIRRVQIDSSISLPEFVACLTRAVDWLREIEFSLRRCLGSSEE